MCAGMSREWRLCAVLASVRTCAVLICRLAMVMDGPARERTSKALPPPPGEPCAPPCGKCEGPDDERRVPGGVASAAPPAEAISTCG